ncbi:hypothetical protein G6O67_003517 [Ophiocordyceps sinensis]|uniref:Uncharacterized protein n=1 Tax=Ophiocordyceps sinensis TaxID=72228 RepID=A0A8H4PS15_9HYPO|nr:hypothetical protein G6O67_003517 [Ophiocordyceps sinensis]
MEMCPSASLAKADSQQSDQEVDVYPVHSLDGAKHNHVLISWVMRFNDVLDSGKLYLALSKLLEIGDWKKLGGRLKMGTRGKLEIHVPMHFTASQPAVHYTHDDHIGIRIEEHPAGSQFPEPTKGPSIQPISNTFRPFLAPQDFPKTIQEMQQTSCLLRAVRDELENERGLDWFLGEASAIPILVNNLTKANLIKSAEFGPAVVSRGDDKKTRSNPLGTMVMYYNQPVDTSLKSPSSFYMLGKDFADNYWLMGNLYPRTWLQIDEDLRNM